MISPNILTLSTAQRQLVVFADVHRGDGTGADDFAKNSLTFRMALGYYRKRGFTYVELGDAEELWETPSFDQIYITHTSIYDELRGFHHPDPAQTRYIKIWGNHDSDWRDRPGPLENIFPGIRVYEGLLLDDHILLIHGHQADPTCRNQGARFSKFFVRAFWSRLQRLGFLDPTRAANNPGLSNRVDESLYDWAKNGGSYLTSLGIKNGRVDTIIAGHTHRPVFANLSLTEKRYLELGLGTHEIRSKLHGDKSYYNAGSCVHPRAITGLEIVPTGGTLSIALVRWGYEAQREQTNKEAEAPEAAAPEVLFSLKIGRRILEQGSIGRSF